MAADGRLEELPVVDLLCVKLGGVSTLTLVI